jgi:hypothetical protein
MEDDAGVPTPHAEPVPAGPNDEAHRARYLKDLRERGEVVPKDREMPPGATHEIEDEDGEEILRRRRFSVN